MRTRTHTTGLQAALDLLAPIKAKHPSVSYADLFQMASAAGVEVRACACACLCPDVRWWRPWLCRWLWGRVTLVVG
jgi:hypothetical protein